MDLYSDSWFKYLREELITEGLDDIGLPERVVSFINQAMPDSPEKSKMLIGNLWKNEKPRLSAFGRKEVLGGLVQEFLTTFKEYIEVSTPDEDAAAFIDDRIKRGLYDVLYDRDIIDRPELDDKQAAQAKIIKFVLQNVKALYGDPNVPPHAVRTPQGAAKPHGEWRKVLAKAVKALKKAGLSTAKVERIQEYLQEVILMPIWTIWWAAYGEEIGAFLNLDPTNYELAKKEAYNPDTKKFDHGALVRFANAYLDSLEKEENIIHTFDDGSYWYNLDTSSCSVEAERMGHCGEDNRGTLVSLRLRRSGRRESSSYVTMTWNQNEDILYQIKGRNNLAPDDRTWPHIAWFIDNLNISDVHEDGEYSNDVSQFGVMNDWLQRNTRTNVKFQGNMEEALEAVQGAIERINEVYYAEVGDSDHVQVSANVDLSEYGDPTDIELHMDCLVNFQIDLGWDEIIDAGVPGHYYAGDGAGNIDKRFEPIPLDGWGSEPAQFRSNVGLDDYSSELPGDNAEEGYKVIMLEGLNGVMSAHIEVEVRNNEYRTLHHENAADEYQDYVNSCEDFNENYKEYRERLRRNFVENHYAAKSAYDRSSEDLLEFAESLNNFDVTVDDVGKIKFQFSPEIATDTPGLSEIELWSGVHYDLSQDMQYTVAPTQASYWGILPLIWGGNLDMRVHREGPHTFVLEGPEINAIFSSALQKKVAGTLNNVSRQMKLDFGDDYKNYEPEVVLASDSNFIARTMKDTSSVPFNAYPKMAFSWEYFMTVDVNTPSEEFEVVKNILGILDKNPKILIETAEELFEAGYTKIRKNTQEQKKMMESEQEFKSALNNIVSAYKLGPYMDPATRHDDNPDPLDINADSNAMERQSSIDIASILRWFESNWSNFDSIEKFIMWTVYLDPLGNFTFRRYGPVANVAQDGPGTPIYPRNFSRYVLAQKERMGVSNDSAMEEQVIKIDNLLNELDPSYDLRIYNIEVGCTIERHRGGSESETATEIRGIEGVTTVRPVAARKRNITPTAGFVLFDIKFELLGSQSRVDYRDKVLLPALRKIRGLKILTVSSIHRTNRRGTIRTVRESVINELGMGSAFGYGVDNVGGLAGNLGSVRRQQTRDMPTPRPQLQSILDDWVEGGVMAYDAPTNYTDMRYHVMMPVEELLPFITSEYRGDMKDFQGRYKHFISTGPQAPVYLAIGQNGRIKITGGEDLVWFAKKSGLEELPCFFSYQKQV